MRRVPSEVRDGEYLEAAGRVLSLTALAETLNLSRTSMHDHLRRVGIFDEVARLVREKNGAASAQDTPDEGVSGDGAGGRGWGYVYDPTSEMYVFEVAGAPVLISRESWRFVYSRYPERGIDGGWTVQEIADELGLPRQTLTVCLRKYDFYKSSQPFTHEDFMEMSDEEADAETIEMRRSRYNKRIGRKLRADLERENAEYRIREANREKIVGGCAAEFRSLAEEMASLPTRTVRLTSKSDGPEYALHAPVSDLHAGKLVWGEEAWGGNYDLKTSCGRLVEHAEAVAAYICRTPGTCGALYLTDLGDMFHALNNQTENGTLLHQDSRPLKVWREVMKAKIRAVETLRPHAKEIHVLGAPGNHDGLFFSLFFEALAMRYENEAGVYVSDRAGRYNHFLVGDTLHLLDHGKFLGKLNTAKTKAEIDVEIRRVAGEDFYRSRTTVAYFGHLHEHEEAPHGGHLQLIRLPAFSETDDYETDHRYYSTAKAIIFRLDGRGRRVAQEYVYLGENPAEVGQERTY